ncbi:MAG: serine protein kinase RIO [Candidatus Geothermarchaeales archaeon]
MTSVPPEKHRRVMKKLQEREDRFVKQQLLLRRISDDYETLEEVWDRSTLMTLYRIIRRGAVGRVHGTVASGKEARVYAAEDPQGTPLAVKIYLVSTAAFKRGRMKYLMGDPRFRSVGKKTRNIVYAWTSKEFKNLTLAHRNGVRVPKPIYSTENVLVMEFVGEDFVSAPTLKELNRSSKTFYRQILSQVRRLYRKAGLVHSDLSEFNIFYYGGKPVLFDFAQAVVRDHPLAEEFLSRDISNITRFYERRGIEVWDREKTISWITGR